MNILILSHKPPYPIVDGGCHAMDRFLRDTINAFPNANIQHLCIATQKHPYKERSIPKELAKKVAFDKVEISTRINLFSAIFQLLRNKSYHISRFKKVVLKNKITEILKQTDFEYIVFESIFCGAYIDEVKRLSNAQHIHRAHNVEHLIWNNLALNTKNPIKRWYFQHLSKTLKDFELNFISKVDHVFTIAPSDNNYFKKIASQKPAYIPVSMQIRAIQKLKPNSISFLGAYNWMPNKEAILWFTSEVLPDLVATMPELTLNIAGSFSEEIPTLKGNKCIKMHGFVASSKEFISNQGIFVAPILSGSGVKMKVLEAMSLGVPCVVSAHAASGLEFPKIIPICHSKEDFIRQVSLLLQDKELAIQVGIAGQEYIKKNYATEFVSNEIKEALSVK